MESRKISYRHPSIVFSLIERRQGLKVVPEQLGPVAELLVARVRGTRELKIVKDGPEVFADVVAVPVAHRD